MQGKICLIGERLAGGGAERVMAELSTALTLKGYQVHLVTVLDDIHYTYSGELFNLGLHKNASNSVLNKFKRMRLLRSYLRQHRFDAIVDFRLRYGFLQEYLLQKIVFNSPVFYTVHSSKLEWYFPENSALAQQLYRSGATPIAVSSGIVQAIKQKYPSLHPRLIYNGIFLKEFAQGETFKLPNSAPYVFMVGSMYNPNKQFDVAIRCFAQSDLPARGWKLLIAGKGDLLPQYQAQVADLALTDSVLFIGYQHSIAPYFKGAQATLLCSQYEGFPRTLVESLACETPVISYDMPTGPYEIIQEGVNGILVENQNEQALVAALQSVVDEPERWHNYKKQALNSVKRWDWEEIIGNWERVLKNP